MPSSPITIGLVFGGRSEEHDVSIRSAATVVRGLRSGQNRERYMVQPIYIDREGRWWETDLSEATLTSETAPELNPLYPPQDSRVSRRDVMWSTSGTRCCMVPMERTAPFRGCSS